MAVLYASISAFNLMLAATWSQCSTYNIQYMCNICIYNDTVHMLILKLQTNNLK